MPLDIDLQMARLEVKLLRAQFSSHFLFNHLNAINYRILREDPTMASSYLTLFARLLRRITADSRREFVRLSDEMETIRLFIKLESMRFSQPIHFVTSIEPGIDPAYVWVPSLVLHTYVENAIWHVLQQREEAGAIQLKLIKKSTRYHLLLEDNGKGRSKRLSDRLKPHDQAGLDLVGERLRLLNRQFGTDLRVTLGNPELAGESHAGVPGKRGGYLRAGR
ncbi:sensor histidine kinase [Salmonirosea aquatica]|uniref:Signal transduction histidine kinase internal region domain-containing protein n=1 Tax=Salmonirosea aquatica TaxID=2654236 RepID=A0A7C9FXA7_9BACT|nr:hypothetical protein [Cytophagaceae bacterium SJW1-29]